MFQSTPPVRGATPERRQLVLAFQSFNPRPPCGERQETRITVKTPGTFQSTPPVRGATLGIPDCRVAHDVSIHAPRAGSDIMSGWLKRLIIVSIHAPRAGSDSRGGHWSTGLDCFNPRPPCGERQKAPTPKLEVPKFQSTPPVRGATVLTCQLTCRNHCFNPRPPCGERHLTVHAAVIGLEFQSTPPVRGATCPPTRAIVWATFQSTPPVRGATPANAPDGAGDGVSIHAPRAGSDLPHCAHR